MGAVNSYSIQKIETSAYIHFKIHPGVCNRSGHGHLTRKMVDHIRLMLFDRTLYVVGIAYISMYKFKFPLTSEPIKVLVTAETIK